MYSLRIPGIINYKLNLTPANAKEELAKLPPPIRWPADNYNHLFEVGSHLQFIAFPGLEKTKI